MDRRAGFVTACYDFDLIAILMQFIQYREVAFPRHTEDMGDSVGDQRLDETRGGGGFRGHMNYA